ncbi:hypothetical protein [Mycoplasma sp. HS2188]|uniref:hypothetical protein n=1 Tax=Mycoplasma sp. HS2188 TaxID=2976765 RepID=UPI0021AA26C0|nr:hypothetical protein [Mycoplasma sp. HS2188]MCT4469473.1 hypothetical protein [Mycoplasma sp. HS2188]
MTLLEFDFADEVKKTKETPEIVDGEIKAKKKMVEFWFLVSLLLFIGVAAIYFFINSFGYSKTVNISILATITIALVAVYIYSFTLLFALIAFIKTIKLIKKDDKTAAIKAYKIYKIFKFDWTYNKKIN